MKSLPPVLPPLCLLLLALLLPDPAPAAPEPPGPDTLGHYAVRYEQLQKVKGGFQFETVYASPDGRRVAVAATRGGKRGYVRLEDPGGTRILDEGAYLWIEGLGNTREWAALVSAAWSPDGRRFAYAAVGSDERMHVVVDGAEVGACDFLPQGAQIYFSPDGGRHAFVAAEVEDRRARHLQIVVDGVPGEPFDDLVGPEGGPFFQFAPAGGHWLAICERDGRRHAVVDGRFGPAFDQTACAPVFSPDGEHFAYVAARGEQWYLVHDDTLHGPYDKVSDPAFSPVANDLVYCVQDGERGWVVLNHRPLRRHRQVHQPRFSPDGRRLAYLASEGPGRSFVVVDSTAGPVHISAATPRFQPDGRLFYDVYLDSTGSRRAFYLEDRRLPEMTGSFADLIDDWDERRLQGLWLSAAPAGGRVAYGWRLDEEEFHLVVDDREWDRLVSAEPAVWSPDGRRCAFRGLVNANKVSAFIDGGQGPPYDDVHEFAVSPDGDDFAYVVRHLDEWMLVVDHEESRPWDALGPHEARFQADGSLVYHAAAGKYLYRVVLAPRG